MSGGIYLIQENNQLVEMIEQPYPTEDLLQELLASYPNLLAGDQIDSAAPRRWRLVSREMAVPDEENGAERWALDHLFLDQDGIPTLVEVKRSSDTRIRREVIGQMLDYAANAVVYWPVEKIIAKFEANYGDPEQELLNFLDEEDAAPALFWQKVKTNLQAGKVRLVFVADKIPAELQRVVEFLNKQMDPAEVLAVEIKQYVGQGFKTLVPRVIGQTAEAQGTKFSAIRESKQWDEFSFLQEIEAKRGADEAVIAIKILEWGKAKSLAFQWGKGKTYGSFMPMLKYNGTIYGLMLVWANGYFEVHFERMKTRPPFDEESKRLELLYRLNQIPDVNIPTDKITQRPSIPLSTLKDEAVLQQFLATFDWVVEEIKAL